MLFASRVATQAVKVNGGSEDEWLAEYTLRIPEQVGHLFRNEVGR
jgi:hypothetical protein